MWALLRSERGRWGLAGAVAAIAFLVSAPALLNGFFWDDPIVLDKQLPSIGGAAGAFFPPASLPQWSPAYYRPLVTLSFLLDRAIWGSSPFGYHLTVLLLHALVAGAVYLLARRLLDPRVGEEEGRIARVGTRGAAEPAGAPVRRIGPLVAGLLFAVHPVHADAVAWISGRADVMATLFSIVAILAATGGARSVGRGRPAHGGGGVGRGREVAHGFVVAAASAAALLSKESAIVLPILVGLFASSERGEGSADRIGRSWVGAATSMAGIGAAIVLRSVALRGVGRAASSASGFLLAAHRLVEALAYLARRLVLPWPWSGFHSTLPAPGVPEVAAVLILLGLAAVLFRGARAPKSAERGAAAGRGGSQEGPSEVLSHAGRVAPPFTAVALIPALGPAIISVSLSPIADRYLYLPSVGLALMVAVLAVRLAESAGAVGAIASRVGEVEALGGNTDRTDLELAGAPRAARLRRGQRGNAGEIRAATAGEAAAASRLGASSATEASTSSWRWRALGPSFGLALSGAALLYALGAENVYAVGRYKDDLTFWGAAAGRSPEDGYALVKLGQALGGAGRTEEAEARIRAGLERGGLPPGDRAIAIDNVGDLELRAGRLEQAGPWLERAAGEAPGYALAHIHLARLHRALALRARAGSVQRNGDGSTRTEREPTSEGSGPKPKARDSQSKTPGWPSETPGTPSEIRGSNAISPGASAEVIARDAVSQISASQISASRIEAPPISATRELALSVEEVSKALSIEPRNTEALLLRADLALDRGDRAEAVLAIEEALRYLPAGEQRTRAESALRSLGVR